MALVLTKLADSEDIWGKHRVSIWDITGDTSYPTGGTVVTAAQFAMRRLYGMKNIGGGNILAGQLITHFRTDTVALQVFYPTGGGTVPAAPATPLITAGATAMTSTAANGAADITAGNAIEVANTTNLSAATFRMLVIGE